MLMDKVTAANEKQKLGKQKAEIGGGLRDHGSTDHDNRSEIGSQKAEARGRERVPVDEIAEGTFKFQGQRPPTDPGTLGAHTRARLTSLGTSAPDQRGKGSPHAASNGSISLFEQPALFGRPFGTCWIR